MNTIDKLKEFISYKDLEIKFAFREEDADNRHNRRRRKALERRNNKKNGKYYN